MPTNTYPAQQPPQPGQPGQPPVPQGIPGAGGGQALPPTGLQQQSYALQQNNQGLAPGARMGGVSAQPTGKLGAVRPGQTNLNDLAENLARNYGLALGSTPLVNEQGVFNRQPTSGDEAVKMQFISQAITDEQNRRQQQKGVAAMQQGIGMVQSRGRGSLAVMQSGQYERLASLYASQQYKAADFSFFLENDKMKREEEAKRKAAKKAKKGKLGRTIGMVAGGVIGTFVAPGLGTAAGVALGGELGETAGGYF